MPSRYLQDFGHVRVTRNWEPLRKWCQTIGEERIADGLPDGVTALVLEATPTIKRCTSRSQAVRVCRLSSCVCACPALWRTQQLTRSFHHVRCRCSGSEPGPCGRHLRARTSRSSPQASPRSQQTSATCSRTPNSGPGKRSSAPSSASGLSPRIIAFFAPPERTLALWLTWDVSGLGPG